RWAPSSSSCDGGEGDGEGSSRQSFAAATGGFGFNPPPLPSLTGHQAITNCVADPLRDSGVYNLRNGLVTPLLSKTATVPQHHDGQWRPTWFFPADSTV
ncbi:unnamed protein product, partial [Urochloa humidicola]